MFNSVCRLAAVWLLVIGSIVSATANPKISSDLERANPAVEVNVIVQYKPGSPLRTLLGSVTNLVQQLPLIGAVVFRILPQQALSMAEEPDVDYISLDRRVGGRLDYASAAVNANLAYNAGTTGRGSTVAVIDSGITHADMRNSGLLGLLPRVVYQESFVPGDSRTEDTFGHGTHVAGIIAGDGHESAGSGYTTTFRGIAPEARLMNLRVLDAQGKGSVHRRY